MYKEGNISRPLREEEQLPSTGEIHASTATLPPVTDEKELILAYRNVQNGSTTDVKAIRAVATQFAQIAIDERLSQQFSFDAQRGALALYSQAHMYEIQQEIRGRPRDKRKSFWSLFHVTEESLLKGYRDVQIGAITDPYVIRDLAATMFVIAKHPRFSQELLVDAEQLALALYVRAHEYETQREELAQREEASEQALLRVSESALVQSYQEVLRGAITAPEILRDLAAAFLSIANHPEYKRAMSFDVARAALNLYMQADSREGATQESLK